jgi:hypothetical protein
MERSGIAPVNQPFARSAQTDVRDGGSDRIHAQSWQDVAVSDRIHALRLASLSIAERACTAQPEQWSAAELHRSTNPSREARKLK